MLTGRFGFAARARQDILRYSPRARQTTTMCACSPQLIQASFLRSTMGLKRSIARRARGDGGGFHSGRDVADPTRSEIDLFAEATAPVDVVAAVIKGRQRPEPATGSDVPGVVGQALARVEQLDEMDGIETEKAAALGEISKQIVRGAIADGARRSGRLVDVLVVEDTLCAPRCLVVEIMLPADAGDVARVVATERGFVRGL